MRMHTRTHYYSYLYPVPVHQAKHARRNLPEGGSQRGTEVQEKRAAFMFNMFTHAKCYQSAKPG